MEWNDLKPLDLSKIENIEFPKNKYFNEEFEKKQIVIHHTVGSTVEGAVSAWKENKDNVGTCIIINKDGTPFQIFSSRFWAYHLGAGNHDLDRHSIAIELVNWGWLKKKRNRYYTYYGNSVAVPMQYYPNGFRGYNYYEKYTHNQLQTLGELILYWKLRYNIPLDYNQDIWNVSQRALAGIPGIWSHVSYLPAPKKYDCHPQPSLIELLKTLKEIA